MATKDVRNYTRLNILYLNRATDVLRNKFKEEWKLKYGEEWNDKSCQQLIKSLGGKAIIKRRFFSNQKNVIISGNIEEWDITLLKRLLIQESLFSLTTEDESNIQKLADIRNDASHSGSLNMSVKKFGKNSKVVFDALIALGDDEDELKKLELADNIGGIAFVEVINDEDVTKANTSKELGNKEFKLENYCHAIKHYSNVISLPGLSSIDRAMLHSNRSICYLKLYLETATHSLRDLENATQDAKKTVKLWPQWWKGYYRKAQIFNAKKDYQSLIKAEKYLMQAQSLEQRDEINILLNQVRHITGPTDRQELFDVRNHLTSTEDYVDYKKKHGININVNFVKKMLDTYSRFDTPEHKNMIDCIEGHRYYCATDGYPLDYNKAFQCYSKAASRGSALGYYNVALMYSEGKGTTQDFGLYIEYLKKAAQQPPYIVNDHETTPNIGVAEAEFVLGLCYEIGNGVAKDLNEAIEWYEKAYDHESRDAANNLGIIYTLGKDFIDRDLVRAEQYFKYAASDDDPMAMINVVQIYLKKLQPETALKWCERMRKFGYNFPQIDNFEDIAKRHLSTLENTLNRISGHEYINGENNSELNIKEKIDQKFKEIHRQEADFLQKIKQIKEKSFNNGKSPVKKYTDELDDIETLEKYAKSGKLYAIKLLTAKKHFLDALEVLNGIKDRNNPSYDECKNLIKHYSLCVQTESMVAYLTEDIEDIVRYALTKQSDFDEDVRICYAAFNGKDIGADMIFLTQCLLLYPKNVYFLTTRGSLYYFLGDYEKSLLDFNEALTLAPKDEEILYTKASAMRKLPQMDYKDVFKAYNHFISAAPEDHRSIPECYYNMAHMNLFRRKNYIEAKKYFNLGLIAEEKQLSFFLPYDSTIKEIVELYLNYLNSKLNNNEYIPISSNIIE